MKTAHEILADEVNTRRRREEREKRWSQLVRRCRYPRYLMPVPVQLVLSVALLITLVLISPARDRHLVYVALVWLALILMPMHIAFLWRRERALLAMIQLDAPELYQQLQRERIA